MYLYFFTQTYIVNASEIINLQTIRNEASGDILVVFGTMDRDTMKKEEVELTTVKNNCTVVAELLHIGDGEKHCTRCVSSQYIVVMRNNVFKNKYLYALVTVSICAHSSSH